MKKEEKSTIKLNEGNDFIADVSFSASIEALPINITFTDPKTNKFLGEFKEQNGVLTFNGKVDEAGEVFVNFICSTFNDRIKKMH